MSVRCVRTGYGSTVVPFPSIDDLTAALAARSVSDHGDVFAAVMLCLRDRGRGTEVVLARRAERYGDPWSGHISLPGGRIDPGDRGPLDAAVRETVEEVGFDPLDHGRLLGALGAIPGRSRTVMVAPFATRIDTDVEPGSSSELVAAWWAPIDEYHHRMVHVREVPYEVPALVGPGGDGREAVVWGMTYNLLQSVRSLAG